MQEDDGVGDEPVEHQASWAEGARGPGGRGGGVGDPGGGRAARRAAGRAAGAVLVLAYAWWAVSLPPFSGSATAAVLLAGVVAAASGAARRQPGRRPHHVEGAGAWGVLAAAAGVWQLAAYLQHPRADHPTLSWVTNALLDSRPARAAAFVLWLGATRELARR